MNPVSSSIRDIAKGTGRVEHAENKELRSRNFFVICKIRRYGILQVTSAVGWGQRRALIYNVAFALLYLFIAAGMKPAVIQRRNK